jgi:hypothetical protein
MASMTAIERGRRRFAAFYPWSFRNQDKEEIVSVLFDTADDAQIPPGIASVLSALSSSAVVADGEDRVLRASAAALACGIVKDDRLMVGELRALARQVRRDGESRHTEIEVHSPGRADRTTSFAVRASPLSGAVRGPDAEGSGQAYLPRPGPDHAQSHPGRPAGPRSAPGGDRCGRHRGP